MRPIVSPRIAALLLSLPCAAQQQAPPDDGPPPAVHAVITRYCVSCHGEEQQEGDVRFDSLAQLATTERSDLLALMQEVLHFGEMPPEDAPQPNAADLATLQAWLASQSDAQRDENLRDKLRYPHYGNLVDHTKLFGNEQHAPAFTPARRWLVSPQIFHERVMDVFYLAGRDRQNQQHRDFAGISNPFVLAEQSGVRYYDLDSLDGGDLLVMLGNARWLADRQIVIAKMLAGEQDISFPDPKDRWLPRALPQSYRSFTAILQATETPSDEAIQAAIQTQFDAVLRRPASTAELAKYRQLLVASLELGGNLAGLQQMLIAVLLESEFVYRMEFGAGAKDEHGRRLLAPREGADAISYALGDRRPDAQLLAAAASGKLCSAADYEREVRRLLADSDHYRGQIDPSLNGKHFQSNVTSHPRIVRFFRDFFGYPAATKVFKDPPRSGGIYQNPDRGTTGTPGRLILETDRIVTRFVEQDQQVFARLLTSNEFFVYHDKDNELGRQIQNEWREVYEQLKASNWKTAPEQVLANNLAFLISKKSLRMKDASRPGELVNFMHFFEEYFGNGIEPFTTVPWAHGYTFHHAPLYNLPPTPSIGRYGSWKSTKYLGDKVKPLEFWNYPAKQPFQIEHRMGVLTHPSWLVAHSSNFHPDAIRRGRWIREKLLAGRVPDVPITVDAQVPEDPHKTFRQRVEQVTAGNECWRCHKHMNPLGLPFEAFDDFGRFRREESLEHPDNLLKKGNGKTTFDVYPTAPITTTGHLDGTGDALLDGPVQDPFELITRLSRSVRVRQSIIRHAFRFFLGRNEQLSDSQTLIDADRAYVESGGSFQAVIVSLLSSDSFRFRKDLED